MILNLLKKNTQGKIFIFVSLFTEFDAASSVGDRADLPSKAGTGDLSANKYVFVFVFVFVFYWISFIFVV